MKTEGIDFLTPSFVIYISKHHHHHQIVHDCLISNERRFGSKVNITIRHHLLSSVDP
jgi:hypothetical protein